VTTLLRRPYLRGRLAAYRESHSDKVTTSNGIGVGLTAFGEWRNNSGFSGEAINSFCLAKMVLSCSRWSSDGRCLAIITDVEVYKLGSTFFYVRFII
jgi:hypothetical protein